MQIEPPSWGLERISQRELPLGLTYVYPAVSGHGVNIYIVDTGVDISHPDLKGRAEHGITTTTGDKSSKDRNGHGTMAAGIAAGTRHGVAKEARIIAVKVIIHDGEGYVSDILRGLAYISDRMKSEKPRIPTVINLSFATGQVEALNRVVDSLAGLGALTTSAAGNGDYEESDDACEYSPASSRTTITVGATDARDILASFSNTGNCTDIFAPGVDVSTILPRNKTVVTSGTSFSAPHVAGAAALLFSQADEEGLSVEPREVKEQLLSIATEGVLRGVPSQNNRLLYIDVVMPPGFTSAATRVVPSLLFPTLLIIIINALWQT
ncbi:peptidase S8/S53 domain-containing protein [Fennellomyces sp. T-0311]|nr:peptidase S8/S53 domain-containing protein [Fennellomyces sp. T-0311]